MVTRVPTLAEAVHLYTATVKPADQSNSHRQLNRFLRWFEQRKQPDTLPVDEVKITDVTDYAEYSKNDVELLKPVKEFFTFARKEGWNSTDLTKHIRTRKAATPKKATAEVQPRSVERLTRTGHEDMQRELAELKARLPEITDEIQRAAADKDFRENAPLQAAREEQSKLVGRIQELEGVLKSVEIIEENAAELRTGRVAMGATVVVCDLEDGEELRYTLVSGHEVDIRNGKMSVDSPIGRALLDKCEGEEVEVAAPGGKVRLRISKIEG